MTIETQLKEQLNNIIDNALFDDPLKEKYKSFHLKVSDKINNSYSGLYNPEDKSIEVIDVRGEETSSHSTLLHEVSHHIDYVKNGKTGHKKEFYDIFRKLIYSALDLGYIDRKKMLAMPKRNTDYSKVIKMLKEYKPKEPVITPNVSKLLAVAKAYQFKDLLKSKGFSWNKVNRTWEKVVATKDIDILAKELIDCGINKELLEIKDNSKINMEFRGNKISSDYVVFIDGGYYIKEELKKDGYHWFAPKKQWYKEFNNEEEIVVELERLHKVYGFIVE